MFFYVAKQVLYQLWKWRISWHNWYNTIFWAISYLLYSRISVSFLILKSSDSCITFPFSRGGTAVQLPVGGINGVLRPPPLRLPWIALPAAALSRRIANGTGSVDIISIVPAISGVLGASWSSRTMMSLEPGLRKCSERKSDRDPPRSQNRPRLWPFTQTTPKLKLRKSRNVEADAKF